MRFAKDDAKVGLLVVAAVLCFVQVYGIARAHDPWGWLLWFGS